MVFTRLLGRRWAPWPQRRRSPSTPSWSAQVHLWVRAVLVAGIGSLNAQLGRRQVGANNLAFAAALMCLITHDLL